MRRIVPFSLLIPACAVLNACRGALDPQGPQAERIAELTWVLIGLGTLLFLLVTALLGYALLRRRGVAEPRPRQETGLIIGGGIVLPVVVLFVLMGLTVDTLRDLDEPAPENALRIEVTGRNWWWDVAYPDDGVRTANEIHVPIDRTVVITGLAQDVIHSFWVSQLAGKSDLIPGKPVEFKLRAAKPGVYRGQCAEFCGAGHAQMALYIIAQPEEEFEAWLAAQREPYQQPESGSAERGQDIFFSSSCIACHGVTGPDSEATTGPDLTHFASRSYFAGAYWPVSEQNLEAWITDPRSLKPGANMPATEMAPGDLDDLVAFLLSLE